MAIDLTEQEVASHKMMTGDDEVIVAAGKKLEIAYWAPGKTMALDEEVPVGKQWTVNIFVRIVESDA